ncbi:MAG: Crp/Fnr family transcriptional regulator [Sandaracinaceae bacterium]|nr:Crp/Fnr family transcriptional regulator [Sandaracinaceae bacterium]
MAIAPRSADELLRDVDVIRDLPPQDLHALAEGTEIRKAAKGAPLFSEGQPAEGLFIVRTGEVKLTKSGRDGREQIIYLARPGRPVVEGIRFDGGAYPATAVAMRTASAVLVPNEHIAAIGGAPPGGLPGHHRSARQARVQDAQAGQRSVAAHGAGPAGLVPVHAGGRARELRGEDAPQPRARPDHRDGGGPARDRARGDLAGPRAPRARGRAQVTPGPHRGDRHLEARVDRLRPQEGWLTHAGAGSRRSSRRPSRWRWSP